MNKALQLCFLIVFLLVLFPVQSPAQSVSRDSSELDLRHFDKESRELFLNDPDFFYDRPVAPAQTNWLQRFLRWITHLIDKLYADDTPRWVPFVIFGLFISTIVGLLLYVFGVDIRSILGRSEKAFAMDYQELSGDIHALDFDQLVRESVAAGQYRRAVRLLYLESLKNLSTKGWINWQINKTNRDYQLELTATRVAQAFDELTLHYEYVWYGDFPVDAARYQHIEQVFRGFQQQLKQKA